MVPIAHLSAGLAVYKISSISNLQIENSILMGTALLGSLAPDIDGLFGSKMKDHRYTIFHAPIFWLSIYLITHALLTTFGYQQFLTYLITFIIGTFIHLLLDFLSARTSGVWIFYPFSKRAYSLFKLQPEMGDTSVFPSLKDRRYVEFWKFYLQNKVLVIIEVLFILFSLLIFLFYPFGS